MNMDNINKSLAEQNEMLQQTREKVVAASNIIAQNKNNIAARKKNQRAMSITLTE
jgi:hypothetical protein